MSIVDSKYFFEFHSDDCHLTVVCRALTSARARQKGAAPFRPRHRIDPIRRGARADATAKAEGAHGNLVGVFFNLLPDHPLRPDISQAFVLFGSKSSQSTSFLINVLRIVSSFLIAAVNATFFGFPFARRRW